MFSIDSIVLLGGYCDPHFCRWGISLPCSRPRLVLYQPCLRGDLFEKKGCLLAFFGVSWLVFVHEFFRLFCKVWTKEIGGSFPKVIIFLDEDLLRSLMTFPHLRGEILVLALPKRSTAIIPLPYKAIIVLFVSLW